MKLITIRNASHIKIGDVTMHLPKDKIIEVLATHGNYDLSIQERNLPPLSAVEEELVRDLQHIVAIKNYRKRTGCGLLESKMAVDMYRDTMRKED